MNASSKQFLAVAGLLFVTFVWGLTFIYVKWTIAETGAYYWGTFVVDWQIQRAR